MYRRSKRMSGTLPKDAVIKKTESLNMCASMPVGQVKWVTTRLRNLVSPWNWPQKISTEESSSI